MESESANKKLRVAHLTSVHKDRDIRIFLKECVSMAEAGFEMFMVVPNGETRTESGVNVVSFEHQPKGRLGRMWGTVNRVYKEAIKIDADVYHMHDPELLRIAKKLKRRGKKVVYDTHEDLPRQIISKGYIYKGIRKFVANRVEKFENRICRQLDGVITATPHINDRFIKVNSNSLNVNNFPLASEFTVSNESDKPRERKVCYIGGISFIRGVREMVEAIGIVEVPFIVGGKWPDEVIAETKDMKGFQYAERLGFIGRDVASEIKETSSAGLLLFLPEPNHIYAQPNKLFEYMASGLPVIASHFELWKQIIEVNHTGLCVDPEDPKAIAEAIQYILDHPEEAKKMGENGRRVVVEKYNWDIEKVKLINFYNKLAEN